jgi:hypothetical protein
VVAVVVAGEVVTTGMLWCGAGAEPVVRRGGGHLGGVAAERELAGIQVHR